MDGPSLPRSIRWRLQLGVWRLPPNGKRQQHQCSYGNSGSSEDPSDSNSNATRTKTQPTLLLLEWNEIVECNRDLIEAQRRSYDLLVQELQEFMHEAQSEEAAAAAADTQQLEVSFPSQSSDEEDLDAVLVDPLTALAMEKEAQEERLQQLDLHYRKERARRKRGHQTNEDFDARGASSMSFASSSSMFGIIEKDLNRLPKDHHTYHHSRKNYAASGGEEVSFETSVHQRSQVLTQVLQIYAQQHPHIGYRQGMHEVCSYLLLVLEMDLFDMESNHANPHYAKELLDANYLIHDGYCLFEAVMNQLAPAYDVKSRGGTTGTGSGSGSGSPMEQMALSILSLIRDTAGDATLYHHLLSLSCPPELYTTRWVRLMFSREVAGWKNVLLLWDVLFDLISTADGSITSMAPTRYTRPGVTPVLELGHLPLCLVLEATSASMILLLRTALLQPNAETSDSIHRLMNMKALTNILPLTATLLSMMRRIQIQKAKQQHRRSSLSFSELAQNATAGVGQSLKTMWNNSATILRQEEMSTAATSGQPSSPVHSGMTPLKPSSAVAQQTSNNHHHYQATHSSSLAAMTATSLDLSATLHESLEKIQAFLESLDNDDYNYNNNNNNNQGDTAAIKKVPQLIWKALNTAQQVQQDLARGYHQEK